MPDQSVEFLETLEIADTVAEEEEREIIIPKPDTTTLVPFDDAMIAKLMVATIARNSIVSPERAALMRDSMADRKGLWQTVRLTAAPAERRVSLAAVDTTAAAPFNGPPGHHDFQNFRCPVGQTCTRTPSGFHCRP